jgi:hypothetical protein
MKTIKTHSAWSKAQSGQMPHNGLKSRKGYVDAFTALFFECTLFINILRGYSANKRASYTANNHPHPSLPPQGGGVYTFNPSPLRGGHTLPSSPLRGGGGEGESVCQRRRGCTR